MGLTERHWFENEDVPENYEWALEDAAHNSRANKKPECVADREKVIKGLKAHRERTVCINEEGEVCPYFSYEDCHRRLTDDALELLKEKEQTFSTWRLGIPYCNNCGAKFSRGYKYCPGCGRAVKWE